MDVLDYNPWWQGEPDLFFQDWKNKSIRWVPKLLKEIAFSSFGLNFITGPRQVGKSTAVKIYIHRLLEKQVDPYAIFYCPCDELIDHMELGEILDSYLSTKNSRDIKQSLIVLDEITFVNEWWRAIKSRIDAKKFRNDTLIISGSSSVELLKEKERFPGRRGNGKDLVLYPLSFKDYSDIFIKNLISKSLESFTTIKEFISPNVVLRKKLAELFNDYLITGGFPLAIEDHFINNKINPRTKKTYLDWIRGDIIKAGKNEASMKEIITYILKSRCTPVSWLSISKDTSINSPHTIQSYVEALEAMYIVKVFYHINPNKSINYRKNKKIHCLDPFIYRVLTDYTNIDFLDENIVESVVATHFSRIYPSYYWKNSSEIDVVSIINQEPVGFEVKWGPKKWKRPLHFKKKHLLTKDVIPLFLGTSDWMLKEE